MAEDDPDAPLTADEVIAAADEIIESLRSSWRERGFPPEVLAHSMIGAGITELANKRGVDAALQVLPRLLTKSSRQPEQNPTDLPSMGDCSANQMSGRARELGRQVSPARLFRLWAWQWRCRSSTGPSGSTKRQQQVQQWCRATL
jgi:hypothetical protein